MKNFATQPELRWDELSKAFVPKSEKRVPGRWVGILEDWHATQPPHNKAFPLYLKRLELGTKALLLGEERNHPE